MKKYILTEEDLSSMQLLLIDRFKELVMCKDCRQHSDRTGRCDAWFENTPADGYCYKAKAK